MKFILSFLLVNIPAFLFAQDYYEQARINFQANNLDSARYYINKQLGFRPDAQDYFLSGMIHEAEGKDLRALSDYEAASQKDQQLLEAYFQKGLLYYGSGSTEQAIADFSYVIRHHQSSETNAIFFSYDPVGNKGTTMTSLQSMLGRVHQYRGLAFQKQGDLDKAMDDFTHSLRYDSVADAFVNRAGLLDRMGDVENAKKDLQYALKLEPENYLAWYNLVLLDESVTIPDYLTEDEEFTPMLNLLGANAYENGDYQASVKYHSKAISYKEDEELAYLNRGKAYQRLKEYNKARADFLKVIRLNPQKVEAFYLIGNSFFYQKDYKRSVAFYERYLEIDRGYKNVWYNAAMAYLNLNEKDRACSCLENSMRLGMKEALPIKKKHCQNP